MTQLRAKAVERASQFLQTELPLESLGYGVSGFVFAAPDHLSAVKAHHYAEAYSTELQAYKLLRKKYRSINLLGLNIPKLLGNDDDLSVIQMSIVKPPFLLDFAGVKFADPGFSGETNAEIREAIVEQFGRDAHIPFAVYERLKQIGIYYLDLRPSNLNLKGYPGAVEDWS